MGLRGYARSARAHPWWLAAGLLVGALAGVTAALLVPTSSTATATVLVSTGAGASVTELAEGASYAAQRMASYRVLATTDAVLGPAIESLDPSLTGAQARSALTVTVRPGTTLLSIAATDADPDRAAALANAVADSLVEEIDHVDGGPTGATRATVVQQAVAPPATPTLDRPAVVTFGALSGLTLALIAARARDVGSRRIRREEDLARASSAAEVPILGRLPRDSTVAAGPLPPDGGTVAAAPYEGLRAAVRFLNSAHGLVLAAALPGSGTTTIAANLAISCAASGMRVLVVDANLRHPGVASYLGVASQPGLADVLADELPVEHAMVQWRGTSLSVLPAGWPARREEASELLGSAAMAALVPALAADFDLVLYDSPALLAVADGAVLARAVGSVALVVETGRILEGHLDRAVAQLALAGTRPSGTVVTGASVPRTLVDGYTAGHA